MAANPPHRAGTPANNGQAAAVAAPTAPPVQRKTKEQKRAEAEARNAISKEKRDREARVRELEREIGRLETRQRELAAELEEEAIYQQPGKPVQINRELMTVTDLLARTTHEWESVAAAVEGTAPVP